MKPSPDVFMVRLVVYTVTGVWAVTLLTALFTEDYQPLLYASGPMAAVVAFVTGIRLTRNGKDPNEQ